MQKHIYFPAILVLVVLYSCSSDNPGNSNPELDPEFNFDGDLIAYRSDRDGNSEIYTMNTDGGNPTRLTNTTAVEELPVWRP